MHPRESVIATARTLGFDDLAGELRGRFLDWVEARDPDSAASLDYLISERVRDAEQFLARGAREESYRAYRKVLEMVCRLASQREEFPPASAPRRRIDRLRDRCRRRARGSDRDRRRA